jgi:hypothetical protein
MEKSNNIFTYVLTGLLSFIILGGLSAGMFYLGRTYTLRELEKNKSEEVVQDEITNKPTQEIVKDEKSTITYKTTTFTVTDSPLNQGITDLQVSIPTDATIMENPTDSSATISYNGASLKFYVIHMGFPNTIRKYEIIPNSNMTTKLYRVTYKDGTVSYITDYEDKDISKCSNPDITPALPCGKLLKISGKGFVTEFTGKEDDYEVFDTIMSSLSVVSK